MFRKTVFWLHLGAGLASGIFVFIMSLTGVLLAFEKQIKNQAAASHWPPHEANAQLLTLEQLQAMQKQLQPELRANALVLSSDKAEPVVFRAGRAGSLVLDSVSGQPVDVATPALDQFFRTVEDFHRWLNMSGESRATGRQLNDIANVVFLFLVLSGLYLWLPPLMKKAMLKARLWFRGEYPNSKSRDYHWHHIFGIWMAIPLALVVYTGMVISYPWAANAMYRVFGAEIPAAPAGPPQGAGGPPPAGALPSAQATEQADDTNWLSLDALVQAALADPASEDWQHLTVSLPQVAAKSISIEVDRGNGTQAYLRHTLTLDRQSGEITNRRVFADTPKAQQLRGIARFLHTGEVLGLWGQFIAAVASFAALFMVYTGFALSWRRLIQPLLKKAG